MAQKRKVTNLMGLAVLATVIQGPMHRYEMASVMRARGKDRDMDIKWGSLYTVVQNLEKNGFLEPIGVTRQGARPNGPASSSPIPSRSTPVSSPAYLCWPRWRPATSSMRCACACNV